ncbi:MAG: hypothetical protein WCP85_01615 [Mariniphaga sp.]
MDVNEEIVEQYLKIVKRWFCMTDIVYQVPRNWGNIDILAYDPIDNLYYDIEVKFRSAFSIPFSSFETNTEKDKFIDQITGKERNQKVEDIIKTKAKKIFVTTHQLFGRNADKRKEAEKRKEMENKFINIIKSKGYECEVWYFDDIIRELFKATNTKGRYNTQLMQTIRLIKTYNNDDKNPF